MEKFQTFLNSLPSSVIGILATALLGIFAWLSKSLIEGPINSSKDTFYKFITSKVEILSEIKSHLVFISYFPEQQIIFKERLQGVLLRDGKTAYIDSEMLASLIHYSITNELEKRRTLELIEIIDQELALWLNKAREDNRFFVKYYSPSPTKRIFVWTSMFFWLLVLLLFITLFLFLVIYFLFISSWIYKISIFSILIVFLFITIKYLHGK